MTSTPLTTPPLTRTGPPTENVEPSRVHFGFAIAFLVLGFLVDYAQFRQVVGRAVPDLSDAAITLIAVGAGAVALYMMFEAGRLEAERRLTTRGRHGRGIVRLLVGIWMFLGFVATYVRLTVPPTQTSSGFGTAAAGGFGTPTSTAVEATWHLGPMTVYAGEAPMALLMLALYAAVGVGAYLFGGRSHRPLALDLGRARRAEKARQRKLRRLTEARDRQADEVLRLRQEIVQTQKERQAMHARATLGAALAAHDEAASRQADLAAERARLRQELHSVAAELDTLDEVAADRRNLADSVGDLARHHARSRLHQHLGDPTRTVKDGDVLALGTSHLEP